MTEGTGKVIVVAGATGDLGGRVATALVRRGAQVRTLIRPGATETAVAAIRAMGGSTIRVDFSDPSALERACLGADCVVSALNGLRSVIVDRQSELLAAAIKASVPRFIPSDFSADFTRTRPGDNRNFDLRREFMSIADAAPIKKTSILNGAFMDMLGAEMPIIQTGIHRVLYWHDADQPLDFTTKDDVAAYVAAAAMDETTPRILRIAGDAVSARDLARIMTAVTGERYRPLWAGSLSMLGAMIGITKLIAPGKDAPFPPWQGMQYMRDMFGGRGKLQPLDNNRYPDLGWTKVADQMSR